MLIEAIGKTICYRWPGGEIVLTPGRPVELPDHRAKRLLERAHGKVRAVDVPLPIESMRAGDWVEWLSPALPKQQGEVLAVYPDGTFEVFHPLSETVCRLPTSWITRVTRAANLDGQS